jgi:hypothetical protein
MGPVYKYIKRYWNKEKINLQNEDFNIDECFTLLQLQLEEAQADEQMDEEKVDYLLEVLITLTAFFMEALNEFKHHLRYSNNSQTFLELGKTLWQQKPTIISFNYDDFIETAIEIASGKNPPHPYLKKFQSQMTPDEIDDLCTKSEWVWNRALAYGIEFDNLYLYDGSTGNREKFVSKDRFYKANIQYSWSILKLHGSINWYKYINQSPNHFITPNEIQKRYNVLKDNVILRDLVWFLPFNLTPFDNNQLYVEPVIIPPFLFKKIQFTTGAERVYSLLWKKAKEELSRCKRIVIIGYSFSPFDFYVKKLILESLCEIVLDELIIVNPDNNAIKETMELMRFKKVITYKNLEEYVTDTH